MRNVKIAVLRTDLNWGERGSTVNNPIALAFARVFPGLRRHVYERHAVIGGYTIKLRPKIETFLRKWNHPSARPSDFAPFVFTAACAPKLAEKARKKKKMG